jgi:hypothetical protein
VWVAVSGSRQAPTAPYFISDPHAYTDKILVASSPELFHRQAPGFPMATRCGVAFDSDTRSTSHELADRLPCAVCFFWPNVERAVA